MRPELRFHSAGEAVSRIPSGSTVAVGGFIGAAHPEALTAALEEIFLKTGKPRDLTLYYCAGQGDRGERGLNHFGQPGLVKRIVGGHWNLAPKLGALAMSGQVEAYNLPQGVLSCLLRETAAGRPGLFTKVGLDTFVDPVHGGGRLNPRTVEDLVARIDISGETYLHYRPIPIDVGLIRATRADRRGNLTMEREGIVGEVLPIAQAAKRSGGIVIAQVEEVVDSIDDPKSVRVPGVLVDSVVVGPPGSHDQTFSERYRDDFVRRSPATIELEAMPDGDRKRIAQRALLEIPNGAIVNLGIGLPEEVARVAAETGRLEDFTLTVESGCVGGIPAGGLSFGCSSSPEAIIDQPSQFDYYDGGGLDVAVLGAAEVDAQGSVNVAGFGGRFAGIGGFSNIATGARKLVFCCTLSVKSGPKFRSAVELVCFHGPGAAQVGKEVVYVTEVAVFRLGPGGLVLHELKPGVTWEELVARMGFVPLRAETLEEYL